MLPNGALPHQIDETTLLAFISHRGDRTRRAAAHDHERAAMIAIGIGEIYGLREQGRLSISIVRAIGTEPDIIFIDALKHREDDIARLAHEASCLVAA